MKHGVSIAEGVDKVTDGVSIVEGADFVTEGVEPVGGVGSLPEIVAVAKDCEVISSRQRASV